MFYVYILESCTDARRRYTGFTHDLRTRVVSHNAGQNKSTASARPWVLVSYFAFTNQGVALAFEKYLKSGSGKTFAKRHLLSLPTGQTGNREKPP